jgi:hypothetical protein
MTPIELHTLLMVFCLSFMLIQMNSIRKELKQLNIIIGEVVKALINNTKP